MTASKSYVMESFAKAKIGSKYLVLWNGEYREVQIVGKLKDTNRFVKIMDEDGMYYWIDLWETDIEVIGEIDESSCDKKYLKEKEGGDVDGE